MNAARSSSDSPPGAPKSKLLLPLDIDNLTYDYTASANSLLRVTDAATVNYGNGDFQNTNGNNNDYTYDVNGNLTGDANKQLN